MVSPKNAEKGTDSTPLKGVPKNFQKVISQKFR